MYAINQIISVHLLVDIVYIVNLVSLHSVHIRIVPSEYAWFGTRHAPFAPIVEVPAQEDVEKAHGQQPQGQSNRDHCDCRCYSSNCSEPTI